MSQSVPAEMLEKTWGTWSLAFTLTQRLLRLASRVRPHAWTMLCARALRRWKIRPMSALRGIRHSRALVWQRVRGVARACRNGAGYRINYNDPIQEEQEMVCLEVWLVLIDFSKQIIDICGHKVKQKHLFFSTVIAQSSSTAAKIISICFIGWLSAVIAMFSIWLWPPW